MFLLLLRDDFADVRLALFKNLDEITKVIDIDSLSQSLLPALTDLAVDKNWRTRAASIEFLSFFARKMVIIPFRDDSLFAFCVIGRKLFK